MDPYTKTVLTIIAILLGAIALKPAALVQAQADTPQLYFEPGVFTLRKPDGTAQVEGKVAIDLRTGNVWGFPTLSRAPYPVDTTRTTPPVSEPMHLGRFDFSKMRTAR
jgi:hypothetical protein